jgi:hypothetical protein
MLVVNLVDQFATAAAPRIDLPSCFHDTDDINLFSPDNQLETSRNLNTAFQRSSAFRIHARSEEK